MASGVPVKVTVACPFSQTLLKLLAIVTTGNGNTVIKTLPVCGLVQLGEPDVAALTIGNVASAK